MDEKSKVYVLIDERNRVTRIEGGYTMSNIDDISRWTYIDEGYGDRYNLCQSNYLPKPLGDDRGIYRYKYDGGIVERTQTEMDEDYEEIIPVPTQLDRIEAQTMFTALMTDTLLEEDEF